MLRLLSFHRSVVLVHQNSILCQKKTPCFMLFIRWQTFNCRSIYRASLRSAQKTRLRTWLLLPRRNQQTRSRLAARCRLCRNDQAAASPVTQFNRTLLRTLATVTAIPSVVCLSVCLSVCYVSRIGYKAGDAVWTYYAHRFVLFSYYYYLPPTKEEVNAFARLRLFVCLSISKITQKRVFGFGWNVACRQMSGHGRTY